MGLKRTKGRKHSFFYNLPVYVEVGNLPLLAGSTQLLLFLLSHHNSVGEVLINEDPGTFEQFA